LQKSLIAGAIRRNSKNPTDPETITRSTAQANALQTYAHALKYLQSNAPGPALTGFRAWVKKVLSWFSL